MDDLAAKKCIPCEIGTPPMSQEEAEKMIEQTPGWTLAVDHITRTFQFKDFKESLEFVNKVGAIAETEGHHPDFVIEYNKVTLNLITHASKGLNENDFIVAAKINALG